MVLQNKSYCDDMNDDRVETQLVQGGNPKALVISYLSCHVCDVSLLRSFWFYECVERLGGRWCEDRNAINDVVDDSFLVLN